MRRLSTIFQTIICTIIKNIILYYKNIVIFILRLHTGLFPFIIGSARSLGFTSICSETMLWKLYEPRKCSLVYHLDLKFKKKELRRI